MLALDLGVFHRQAHVVRIKESLIWSAIWISIALLFNGLLYLGIVGDYPPELRGTKAIEFLTGYVIEKSLSLDNIFVIALLFSFFKTDPLYQHRVLFWGILGAIVMRAILIFAGVSLIASFHWILYIFGAFLVFSGVKIARGGNDEVHPEDNPLYKMLKRIFPVTDKYHGEHFFVVEHGKKVATPLFVCLVMVEWTDLIFAVDSIPAILAVSRDPFIVYTSNIFAILGLRSLYFALGSMMEKFHYLKYGLALILVYVGFKLMLIDIYHFPMALSLGFIVVVLIASSVISLLRPLPTKKEE
jgi:tellurite resistance protein TerC